MPHENTDVVTRYWPHLAFAGDDTHRRGSTLELAPGEVAEVLAWVQPTDKDGEPLRDADDNVVPPELEPLPADFSDPYLKPVAAPKPAPKPATTTTEAGAASDSSKE